MRILSDTSTCDVNLKKENNTKHTDSVLMRGVLTGRLGLPPPLPEYLTYLVKKYTFTSNFLIFFTCIVAFLTDPPFPEEFWSYATVLYVHTTGAGVESILEYQNLRYHATLTGIKKNVGIFSTFTYF
jgi:hypothetical protein